MIAGTFVLKEHIVHFRALMNGRVEYTVENTFNGVSALAEVEASSFGAAMHVALSGRELVAENELVSAEDAMPADYDIRVCADAGAAEVAAVRWID